MNGEAPHYLNPQPSPLTYSLPSPPLSPTHYPVLPLTYSPPTLLPTHTHTHTHRFSFLDFSEYNESTCEPDDSEVPSKSPEVSPPPLRKLSNASNKSPLIKSQHAAEQHSPKRDSSKPRHGSPRPRLTNGLLDPYFKGTHSRSGSSASSNGGGVSPIVSPKPNAMAHYNGKEGAVNSVQETPTT